MNGLLGPSKQFDNHEKDSMYKKILAYITTKKLSSTFLYIQ